MEDELIEITRDDFAPKLMEKDSSIEIQQKNDKISEDDLQKADKQDDEDVIIVGSKKGLIFTDQKNFLEYNEDSDVEILGSARVPDYFRYLQFERLASDPFSEKQNL